MDPEVPIVVVTDPGRAGEARTRLGRIGFDHSVGYLPQIEAVLDGHPEQAEQAKRLPAADLAAWISGDSDLQLLDVRNPSEQAGGTIPGAKLIPLRVLRDRLRDLDRDAPTVVTCASGHRSSIAASLLRARGFRQVADLLGGFDAWSAAGLATTAPKG